MNLPDRKPLRLKFYNYSQNGVYFITICAYERAHLFGRMDSSGIILNNAGNMVYEKFEALSAFYPYLSIAKLTVMPNHLHAIVYIEHNEDSLESRNGTEAVPYLSLSDYIQRFKSLTTKAYIDGVRQGVYPSFNKKIWQKSYYDHVIKNEPEYLEIWNYIDTNPLKWQDDEYYS